MGLAEDMIAVFGNDNLQQAPRKAVDSLKIPTASKNFLAQIGLPREEILVIRFEIDKERFTTLLEHATARKQSVPPRAKELYLIGRGHFAPDLFVDEGLGGSVVEIELGPKGWTRFVNSSVESLAAFLLAFRKSFIRDNMSNEENSQYVSQMKKDLLVIDKAAFAQSDNWWSQVFEQMEDGSI